jgi:hypothetical protein
MSRKLFVVVAVVTLVLATLVAPAVPAPPNVQGQTLNPAEAGSELGGVRPVPSTPIQLSGGSECGGAGGCPV